MQHRGWILLPALVVSPPGQESLEEYQALAKVLKHFIALVTWPGLPDAPIRIGVLGGAGFGSELDFVMSKSTVGGRKVQIRYLSTSTFLSEPPNFDVVFIDRGEDGRLSAILSRTRGKAILTVSYLEPSVRKGVMVNFLLESNRIRFEVNPTRIKEAGLTISSHLLSIAKVME